MGLTAESAADIQSRWLCLPEDVKDINDFLDFSLDQIRLHPHPDALDSEDDWRAHMAALGINADLQKSIMVEEHDTIRSTETCDYWLLDTINMNYATLQH
jgi:hypothetical protein